MPKATNVPIDVPPRRRVLIAGAGLGLTATACTRTAGPPHRGAPGPGSGSGPGAGSRSGPGGHAARQAGVTTPQQATALVLAYDLDPAVRGASGARALREVLEAWTDALAGSGDGDGSQQDRLTATVGVGPRLPALLGVTAPAALRELPAFPGDRLDPARCGGDVLVQLCADDSDTAEETAESLTRLAGETLRPRWRQSGFLPPPPDGGGTPRDLLGFKNGSANPGVEECERWVWSDDATYLVVRRVHLRVEDFARLAVHRQEEIVGRRRSTGGPLPGGPEHAEVDVFARSPKGRYLTPARSHVGVVSPQHDDGARMLRRGYSYADGPTDQGLLFLAFMRDPALFTRVQRRMATRDELSGFIETRGSALAYILPGAGPDRPLGADLLA